MAAYAALISLGNTILHLDRSSRISLDPSSENILELVFNELKTFLEILERLDKIEVSKSRKKVNALDGKIKESVWEFEDLLESHLCNNILGSQFSIDLECLQDDADSFIDKLKEMQEEYVNELNNMPPVEADELVSSEFDSVVLNTEMVGLSREYEKVIKSFMEGDLEKVAIIGMPGLGKTMLAKKVFEGPEVSRCFEHRVWVSLGRNHEASQIERDILAELDASGVEGEGLKERLKGNKCLIVLDDVWDKNALEFLDTCLPEWDDNDDDTKFGILITSRVQGIVSDYRCVWMQLLDIDNSRELLRQRVFGDKGFPSSDLKEAAEKIAKKCEGLPLMILRVADRLSEADDHDPEFWNEVANKRRSSVFMEAYEEISEVLFPTYDCLLSQHAKMLFINIAAFPHDYEIPFSKIINLLTAERFPQDEYDFVRILRDYGQSNQIVFIIKWATKSSLSIKTFGIRSWWWHLLNREAYKDKINRVFYSGDEVEEGVEGHRRLCLHTNFLLNFEIVYETVKCDCASTARSLLCFGPYHKYSMPLDVEFKLLRVVDALRVRFYSFPMEILHQVLLQYLALTCNGEFPPSISNLFNLQFLIIHPHMNIRSYGQTSYLPEQIWDMQELMHIEILNSNLPKTNSEVSLKKLSTLLGVSPKSCTPEVFEKIPNLRKLGIQIELTPNPHEDAESNPVSCFDHIHELNNLESLKCSVVNPEMTLIPTPIISMFPSKVQKLDLSGLGYPWECMKAIGSLPHLKVLKLRCYAFRGPKWEPEKGSFVGVEYLIVEDTDLVQWQPADGSFPSLLKLSMKHCYRLKELDWPSYTYFKTIELEDCNPLGVACAKKLRDKYDALQVLASFDNKEMN